jgi:hypothetical protein
VLHYLEAKETIREKGVEAVRVIPRIDERPACTAVGTLNSGVGLSEWHSGEKQHCPG